jgi:hypothetical protein
MTCMLERIERYNFYNRVSNLLGFFYALPTTDWTEYLFTIWILYIHEFLLIFPHSPGRGAPIGVRFPE